MPYWKPSQLTSENEVMIIGEESITTNLQNQHKAEQQSINISPYTRRCGSPQKWIRSILTKGQDIQTSSCFFRDM